MQFSLHAYADRMRLAKLNPAKYRENYIAVQEMTLASYRHDYLFHLTTSRDEISMFFNAELEKETDINYSGFQIYEETYRVIELHCLYIPREEHGIDHIGIVSTITGVLSKHKISILYVNSYSHNYVFLREQDYIRAIDILIKEHLIEKNSMVISL